MRKSILFSCTLAVTLGMASQAFAGGYDEREPVTAKLKCDAQLKLSNAQICTADSCLDVVEALNDELETNHKQVQQFNLDCAQAISATMAIAQVHCFDHHGRIEWLAPPSSVPSSSGEIVNMTALCVGDEPPPP